MTYLLCFHFFMWGLTTGAFWGIDEKNTSPLWFLVLISFFWPIHLILFSLQFLTSASRKEG